MAADLNFAVCVSFREDKAKTKQLRFLPYSGTFVGAEWLNLVPRWLEWRRLTLEILWDEEGKWPEVNKSRACSRECPVVWPLWRPYSSYSCIPALLHVTYRVITRFRRFSCPCFPALSTCCMLSYLCLVGYNVLFSGIVFASESLHKGKSPVCFIFYWFDWIFIGAVTNSQIIPKPLYLDNPPPKSSLPPIQPFKRHVHVPNQSREKQVSGHSGTAEGESNSDSIRLVLKGKLSEVWFSFEIEC